MKTAISCLLATALSTVLVLGSRPTGAVTTDGAAGGPPALSSLPSLLVKPYMGRWYQVALYPNRFQKHCASDTSANYRQRADGLIEVLNRCRDDAGKWDQADGLARPVGQLQGDRLSPAQLQVSFLPAWLRWLPVGWGSYWVIKLADDQRYAVVSEPGREYLWILSRTPQLRTDDEIQIKAFLRDQGFDLARLQVHRHGEP